MQRGRQQTDWGLYWGIRKMEIFLLKVITYQGNKSFFNHIEACIVIIMKMEKNRSFFTSIAILNDPHFIRKKLIAPVFFSRSFICVGDLSCWWRLEPVVEVNILIIIKFTFRNLYFLLLKCWLQVGLLLENLWDWNKIKVGLLYLHFTEFQRKEILFYR